MSPRGWRVVSAHSSTVQFTVNKGTVCLSLNDVECSLLHGMRRACSLAMCLCLRIVFVIKCVCVLFKERVFMLREVISYFYWYFVRYWKHTHTHTHTYIYTYIYIYIYIYIHIYMFIWSVTIWNNFAYLNTDSSKFKLVILSIFGITLEFRAHILLRKLFLE